MNKSKKTKGTAKTTGRPKPMAPRAGLTKSRYDKGGKLKK